MELQERFFRSDLITRLRRYLGRMTGVHLKLKRFTPSASEALRVAMNIIGMEIDCVLDVGANKGQFGQSLYDFGYKDQIISFEPVESAYKALLKRASRYKNWTVAKRCAIGDQSGTVQINVSDDSVFSSILRMNPHYVSQNPKSRVVSIERVAIYSLDSLSSSFLSGNETLLLKIDTEGYEKQVLKGAPNLLQNIVGLKIEIPLYPIHDDPQYNFYDTIEFVGNLGFLPYSFNVEGVDIQTGRVNTIDGLFFRQDTSGRWI